MNIAVYILQVMVHNVIKYCYIDIKMYFLVENAYMSIYKKQYLGPNKTTQGL